MHGESHQVNQSGHVHDTATDPEHTRKNPHREREHDREHHVELVVDHGARAVSEGATDTPQASALRALGCG
jgi:hypothetical protein